MNSYDVIAGAVKDYWKVNYPQDVVAFFQQKYSWDDKWERCEELVECNGIDDYENMTFLSDFCEGQTEVKDVVIIPLREVTELYYKRKIESHESKPATNADRIRNMTEEQFANWLVERVTDSPWCKPDAPVDQETKRCQIWDCEKCALDWLRQEAKQCTK